MPSPTSAGKSQMKSNPPTKRSRMHKKKNCFKAYHLGLIHRHERITTWYRRFDRYCSQWKRENKAWWEIGFRIRRKIHGAAQEIQRRWSMNKEDSVPAEAAFTPQTDLFMLAQPRANVWHKVADKAVELALAPVFYCCVALDQVSRPTKLPSTSVFSASVISFVLKIFTLATELQQKHTPLKSTNTE